MKFAVRLELNRFQNNKNNSTPLLGCSSPGKDSVSRETFDFENKPVKESKKPKEILTGKEMSSTELELLAENEGINRNTLRRAKIELKTVSYPIVCAGGRKKWYVKLPDTELNDNKNNGQQYSSMDKNAILTSV